MVLGDGSARLVDFGLACQALPPTPRRRGAARDGWSLRRLLSGTIWRGARADEGGAGQHLRAVALLAGAGGAARDPIDMYGFAVPHRSRQAPLLGRCCSGSRRLPRRTPGPSASSSPRCGLASYPSGEPRPTPYAPRRRRPARLPALSGRAGGRGGDSFEQMASIVQALGMPPAGVRARCTLETLARLAELEDEWDLAAPLRGAVGAADAADAAAARHADMLARLAAARAQTPARRESAAARAAAADLIVRLLALDPCARLAPRDALRHPYLLPPPAARAPWPGGAGVSPEALTARLLALALAEPHRKPLRAPSAAPGGGCASARAARHRALGRGLAPRGPARPRPAPEPLDRPACPRCARCPSTEAPGASDLAGRAWSLSGLLARLFPRDWLSRSRRSSLLAAADDAAGGVC